MSKSHDDLNPSPGPMFELRKALEDEREIELPMDPAYYDRLHSRIMGAVERRAKSPSPTPSSAPKPAPAPGFTDARTSALVAMVRARSAD